MFTVKPTVRIHSRISVQPNISDSLRGPNDSAALFCIAIAIFVSQAIIFSVSFLAASAMIQRR